MGLYDYYLAARVRRHSAEAPAHTAVVITERDLLEAGAYDTLADFYAWAFDSGVDRITVYVSVLDAAAVPTLERELGNVAAPREVAVRGPDDDERADAPIQVSVGHGGKHEFATAVRSVADAVAAGDLDPDAIDEDVIESELVFPAEPDLVIKTGAERLSDFMIWQSVYSELYFTDVNWRDFRKRDYLRAVLDYQNRQRRFGR
ncbi:MULTISPECIES: undecaprenyl diphosphate synthase family protein [Halobacterium]|uniref:Tritrans, polycis-undecaprenyl-diphosphatesynthase (Geranylgeranyl-diphosphate specific) n=4 Tax=Halobacterium salinarum TaxID=2242 RepID=A0A510N7M5_HALSA|nr:MULTISPECIES: undecaprenyl diphosphate synthase family protein [Halobacterium]MBB6089011.1 undecaprenyl diphosphate synthase [Halobacterium salinarum]MCF2164768.1 undecaprenyl diphosphate synthase family protein [Halobacterium salinarum]MCF2167553.1 undecaprenyl diphosphate synthase family protein [Halobacterium salinarum]MCF2206789.1 undecaprenyl diphosphate synthase family protein [Halobacterium salinarum]MCF2238769.1 undecaprenyl diphosphate synthase family protein [Halobacterium salinar